MWLASFNNITPSSGMKVAKLEIKMITALFLSGYEYKLVDASGKPPKQFPQPNRNDMHQVCQPFSYLNL
jgi:hypothetical protein